MSATYRDLEMEDISPHHFESGEFFVNYLKEIKGRKRVQARRRAKHGI